MVHRCILCGSASNTHKDFSFHRFPKNETIQSIWIDSLSIKEVVKDWHRICSVHFSPDHFTFKNERKILKIGAIPKMKEDKDEVGNCETSLEHDVNLMSNSLVDVDCCPDIDFLNESPPSTSKRLQKLIIKKKKKTNQKIQLICNLESENDVVHIQEASNINECTEMLSDFNEPPNINHNYSAATSDIECVNNLLKSPSKNTKKKKKKSKVINSKEAMSPKKPNKEYKKTDTSQSVDTEMETYVSNNYIGEDSGKKSEFFDSLDEHTSEYRTMADTSIYLSQYCNQTSKNAYSDKNDLTGNTPLQCDFCFKTFAYRSNLLVHRRTHTGEKPYGCDICGLAFMMQSHLVRHQRTHTGEKPYACDVCGKSFPEESTLVKHKRTHTGEKPYECDVCGQSFSERGNLVRHKRTHPMSNNSSLQCDFTVTGEKPYECDVCGLAFNILSDLVRHQRKHTGEKPFACDVCGKSFSLQHHLVTHNRTHTGEKPYACDVCGKSFTQKNHLVAHNRTHTGDKPYECAVCSRSFTEKKHLVTHTRTHTGEKPYACEVCGKSFSQQHNLVTHNRTHTGEKPYPCDVCGRSFSEKGSLVKHNRTHTGERPYECGQCKKKFSTSRDCKRHTLGVHRK